MGDTTDFVDLCSIPDGFDCIVLKAASDVDIGEEARMQGGQTKVMQGGQTKVMQGEGNDTASYLDVNVPNNSIYYDVHCSNCSACIGRMYTQMPGEQGDGGIVDSFCFDLRRVLRYQLGSSMLMVGKYNVDDGRKEGDGGDVGDHHGEGGIGEQLEERRHERDTTLPVSSNKRPRVDDSDDDMRRRIVELEARLEDVGTDVNVLRVVSIVSLYIQFSVLMYVFVHIHEFIY